MFEVENGILINCNCDDDIITLPNDIKEIAYKAFSNCKVKKIICNTGLNRICLYAFFGSEIEEIVLPATLKCIDEYAFANCFKLSLVELNDGLESIGNYAFMSTKLETINIPSSIKEIGINPFMGCFYIIEMKVNPNNLYYTSYNDSNTICEKSTNKIVSGCKKSVIDNEIKEIGEGAFNGVRLKEIIIPDGVKTLDKQCFAHNSLKTINLNNVENAYDGALMDNNCLKEFTLSNKLKAVYPFFVSRCDKLDMVVLPNSVKLICTDAFYNFLGSTIIIDKNVDFIEERAFSYCGKLKEIKFLGSKKQWLKAISNRNVLYLNKTKPCKYSVVCIDGEMSVDVF